MARSALLAAAVLLAVVAAKANSKQTADQVFYGHYKDLVQAKKSVAGLLLAKKFGTPIAFGAACDPTGESNGPVCLIGCSSTFKTCPWDCSKLPAGSDSQVAFTVYLGVPNLSVCYPKSKAGGLCTSDKFCDDGLTCSDPVAPKVSCKSAWDCTAFPGASCTGSFFSKKESSCSIGVCK